MSYPLKLEENKWQRVLDQGQMPVDLRNYLSRCRLKKIIVSQAKQAWEISFQCPEMPDAACRQKLQEWWQSLFGKAYLPCFHFEQLCSYVDVASLCRERWAEIKEKLCLVMPSGRGWLAEATPVVEGDSLQVVVANEVGWQYLSARGLQGKMAALLQEEYGIKVRVLLVSDETKAAETCCDQQFEEMEKLYRGKFQEALETRNKKQEKTSLAQSAKIVLGKKISGDPVPLSGIIEEEKSVIVCGYLFNIEHRVLKTGRTLITFGISDKTDSLLCKIIADAASAEALRENLAEKKWYVLRGTVQTDRYTQELTLMPYDVMEAAAPVREDPAPEKRVELHLHTKMSALDGLVDVGEAIKRAKEWGHQAVAITDHGVVQAFPEAYEAARKRGIRVIYGVEGYIYNDEANDQTTSRIPTYHCIILAMNQTGLRNLYELVTLSHLHHYHRVPRIPKKELSRLREGLLVGSACEAGELIRAYLGGAEADRLEEIASFYDYLEIQPRGNNRFLLDNGTFSGEEELLRMNRTIYELGKKIDKPVVATGDVHFLEPEDEVYRRILMAGKGFEDADNQAPLYFKTTTEMLEEFSYLGEEAAQEIVVKNPATIAQMVEDLKPIPDELYPPEIPGAEEEIINLTTSRARELYGDPLPRVVKERIEKELNSIVQNGFAVLYLIAHKLVKKSNEDGYLVGSRGSVGSSLVATLCNITEVNPLPPHYRCPQCYYSKFIEDGSVGCGADLPDSSCPNCRSKLVKDGHDTPFEVFLGFKGDKVPDIDLNFSGEYQPSAHKYTEELFGKDNVFRAGTIATVASKTAFGFVKNYFAEKGQVVRSPEITRLVDGCTGVKRTTGQHPGGVMVLPRGQDIHLFTPLQRPADDVHSDTITTHFDYHAISSRLVKLDILGHDDPTVIKMLEDLTGMDCRQIPLDEPKVLSLFQSTEALGISPEELGSKMGTLGIPEFGTKFVRQVLEDTKPTTFSDLVRICGFTHGTDVWLNNAQTLIKSGTAKMSEVIGARDDIMIYLIYKGVPPSKAFKIMEDVRKGKGVKADDVAVMKEHNVPDWYIESCQKIKYLFPKAHAVAYVTMAFRIAYCKIYYPAAFYASFFTVRADEFDADIVIGGIPTIRRKMEEIQKKGNEATSKEEKLYTILELAQEMYLRGIGLQRVNLNDSESTAFLIRGEGKELLPPFISLQGLGQAAAQSIVKAREEKPFTSREDLRIRAKLSKTVLEVLDNHGVLQELPENDQITLF